MQQRSHLIPSARLTRGQCCGCLLKRPLGMIHRKGSHPSWDCLQAESVSTWHFMMGWMTVFNTRQVASWQLEVATGSKCIVCRTVEDMERHPQCWQHQHKAKQHAKAQRLGAVARLTGRTSGNTAERRPRRRDKIYSALWHLVPPVPSFE